MHNEQLLVHLSAPDLDERRLQALTRDALADLKRDASVKAELPSGKPEAGFRGDVPTLGAILISTLQAGGVVSALLNTFKTLFERKPTLQIEIERADGVKVKLNAEHFRPDEIASIEKRIEKLLKA
jgi:Effector Associated Constant Component 1